MKKNDFLCAYGDYLVSFSSYYKHTFYYSTKIPKDIFISICESDIYRSEWAASEKISTIVRDVDLDELYIQIDGKNVELIE